ncbi:MAG TPA: ribosomal protein S18-alanine N-acetyltransferase [Pyrinomonadaceae bacterium]|nr:ribosomal protein S18-alanine N-acetyltransferase [Pyrinomonadaceae bacterium]
MLEIPDIQIIPASINDAKVLRDLAASTNIDAWSESDYRDEIERTDSVVFVTSAANTEVIAFILARIVPGIDTGNDAEVYNIAVRKNFQRSGVGSALLGHLMVELRSVKVQNVWLEVRESNKNAVEFYENQGFLPVSTRPNFYSSPVDTAVVMRLSLTEDFS